MACMFLIPPCKAPHTRLKPPAYGTSKTGESRIHTNPQPHSASLPAVSFTLASANCVFVITLRAPLREFTRSHLRMRMAPNAKTKAHLNVQEWARPHPVLLPALSLRKAYSLQAVREAQVRHTFHTSPLAQ